MEHKGCRSSSTLRGAHAGQVRQSPRGCHTCVARQQGASLAVPLAFVQRLESMIERDAVLEKAKQVLFSTEALDFFSFLLVIQLVYQIFARTIYAGPELAHKRSWIITTFAAFCASTTATPFVFDLIWCGLDWTKVTPHRELIANPLSMFFLAYLISDLVTGFFCYRKHVNLSSGWVHHTLYSVFTVFWLGQGWSHAFATALLMEMPTWVMGLGVLHPRFRSYWAFTLTFLATRIVFHFVFVYSLFIPTGRYVNQTSASWGPFVFGVLALPMHLIWAYKSVRGLRRRMRKLKAEAKAREEARLAAIDKATRLLDSADELEEHALAKKSAQPSRVLRSSDTTARARKLVTDAAYVLWRNAPEAWRQAYREEVDFTKQQGIDPKSMRRSTLVRRALARHLLQGNKRGHNVPLVAEDDHDDLDDWMSITSLNTIDQDGAGGSGHRVSIGRGININVPREFDPIIKGQKYVVSEFPVDREASGTVRQRIVGDMRRRFEVARRDMVVF